MPPSISVVMPAYNAAPWIAEALAAVLAQTDPPEEVIVVDDGSTDDTLTVLEQFSGRITVVEQANAGCGAAFNRAIAEARAEYVALCPADDVWEPCKLAWQRETLAAHPEVDVSFGAAMNFGTRTGAFPAPSAAGVLDPRRFARDMLECDRVPDPSAVLRRELHQRLGGFVSEVGEDYEFWGRALRRGAIFHYDPRVLVRLRQHDSNLSSNALAIAEINLRVHRDIARLVGDDAAVSEALARDLRRIGRCRLGLGDVRAARDAYRASLAHALHPGAVAAVPLLAVPGIERPVRRYNAAHGRA